MSFELVGLGKLLKAMYADRALQTRLLRTDIREEFRRLVGPPGDGGDFYVPFWADAKNHVRGNVDLREQTEARILQHRGRRHLYPRLRDGFLLWWEEGRRQRNVPFRVIEENIHARYPFDGLGVVKVENTLAITVGDDDHRVIYPYFTEEPELRDEAARIGLWLMSQCIVTYDAGDLRIMDVMRGRTHSIQETPLQGNEEQIFRERYAALLEERQRLRDTY